MAGFDAARLARFGPCGPASAARRRLLAASCQPFIRARRPTAAGPQVLEFHRKYTLQKHSKATLSALWSVLIPESARQCTPKVTKRAPNF